MRAAVQINDNAPPDLEFSPYTEWTETEGVRESESLLYCWFQVEPMPQVVWLARRPTSTLLVSLPV